MTTNGLTLTRKVRSLRDAGLDMLNISLDTLVSAKFEFISRRRGWDKVMGAIEASLATGFQPLKVVSFISYFQPLKSYCLFILYLWSVNNISFIIVGQ